ncbi:2'-5' RNA ligase family protein [Microcella humidisoli]|uniref:2'-5' RNA ligase family protein n=1 Tax=Microcella humidisoli TaxID=2963406 RepID=A0ABY5FYQ0_9MICO|nr:2'-5' RNA ligase family protein [Microcella humidisoli]UTT63419.1 2'-5' RNA ligase family protein [Microcella humidisoli]
MRFVSNLEATPAARESSESLYAVVALFTPIGAGTSFLRSQWPPHLTLASNFTTAAQEPELRRVVREQLAGTRPIPVTLGSPALFGSDQSVPVLLVSSEQVAVLHDALADLLMSMEGFAAREPEFWRTGFQPHVTVVPGAQMQTGDDRELRHVILVRLDGPLASVIDSADLLSAVESRATAPPNPPQ